MTMRIMLEKYVDASPEQVYRAFLDPAQLMEWYTASPDWMTPYATVNPKPGGELRIGFRHKTEGHEFAFEGTFVELREPEYIAYTLSDDRQVEIWLSEEGGRTKIVQSFDPEDHSTRQQQQEGWGALLDSLERYLQSISENA